MIRLTGERGSCLVGTWPFRRGPYWNDSDHRGQHPRSLTTLELRLCNIEGSGIARRTQYLPLDRVHGGKTTPESTAWHSRMRATEIVCESQER